MIIDITLLNQNIEDEIIINEKVNIPSEYLIGSEIKELKDVEVSGKVFLDEEENPALECTLSGVMVLLDSISQENVAYPFSIEISEEFEENEKKFENILDICDVLWQNIVLEVPLRFTTVTDYSNLNGDGWRVVSEEEVKQISNNPFKELESMFGKE